MNFDEKTDKSHFRYPIWTQQQNGMLLISSQKELNVFKYIKLPPKKKTEKSVKAYAFRYFKAVTQVEAAIQKKIQNLKKAGKAVPRPKLVDDSLSLKLKQRLSPPQIARLVNQKARTRKEKISIQTVRRRFDDGTIKNLSDSKTHRWTSLEHIKDVFEFI